MVLLSELFPQMNLPALQVAEVSMDSRQIGNHTLFIAIKGERVDGHDFLLQVQEAGAVAAVVQKFNPALDLLQIEVEDPREALGQICAQVYGSLKREQYCLAFTGTDGKTTMASLAEHLLTKIGQGVGFIGTTGVRWPGHDSGHASFTTPFPPQLHQTLQEMSTENISHVCMEVSSHALVQNRVAGLRFKTACFSHLAVDHLDFHQTIANYAAAKAKLFRDLDPAHGVAVLNADDLTSYKFLEETAAPCIFYSLASRDEGDLAESALSKTYLGEEWLAWQKELLLRFPSERRQALRIQRACQIWRAEKMQATSDGFVFDLCVHDSKDWGLADPAESQQAGQFAKKEMRYTVRLPLFGEYNVANALAACASVWAATGSEVKDIVSALGSFPGVVGRMENAAQGLCDRWSVIIDFAHTPGAIAALLAELKRHLKPGAKLWTLCNSCGDRDRSKRSLIGEICQMYADEIILTLEEVGSEDPAQILAEIEVGLQTASAKPYYKIPLRQAAIRFAIERLQDGDILVLPSLGDEEAYALKDRSLPYNDKVFARQIIGERILAEALAAQSLWKKEDFYQVVKINER